MIEFMTILVGVLIGVSAVLASPDGAHGKSWSRFFIACFLSFASVVLPLGFFFLSIFLVPQWKGECVHGWLDFFTLGKLALTPLALWATAALYAVEVLRVKNPTARWIVNGIFLGAVVAVVCFLYGLMCHTRNGEAYFLLVPFYVAVWYSLRTADLIQQAKLGLKNYLGALAASIPFWLASWWWSLSAYDSSPNGPPTCFVVTAASHGHEQFVGPFTETTHRGHQRRASQQLITFWQLEDVWHRRSPVSHACFRRVYNRIGPAIARQVTSPWLADATCAGLKPLEWTARLILKSNSLTPK